MRWNAPSCALLALLTTGCGGRAAPVPPLVAPPAAELLAELASAALLADARLEQDDHLYAEEVEIIADGRRRSAAPRFAGIEPGGQVVVGSTRVDLRGGCAWALVEYHWLGTGENVIREGRATLVFARTADGQRWLVTHAHSSQIR